jgi:hypothetical protein
MSPVYHVRRPTALGRCLGNIRGGATHRKSAVPRYQIAVDPLSPVRLGSDGVYTDRSGSLAVSHTRATVRHRLPYPIALAQTGLGDCALPEDPAEARRLWESARATFAELEAPELAEVQQRLSVLGGEDHLRSAPGRETMVW